MNVDGSGHAMKPLSFDQLRVWFWIAALANFLVIAFVLRPAISSHKPGIIPMEFFVCLTAAVTLVGLPRLLICASLFEKIVACCLCIFPCIALFFTIPEFIQWARR